MNIADDTTTNNNGEWVGASPELIAKYEAGLGSNRPFGDVPEIKSASSVPRDRVPGDEDEAGNNHQPPKLGPRENLTRIDGPDDQKPRIDRIRFVTSAELAKTSLKIDYLVDDVIVRGQPCIMAGSKKVLKTNLSIDLVLSLAQEGGHFLGKFRVDKPVRVAHLSGESGQATIAETALRIARQKKSCLEHFTSVIWSSDLPRLGERGDLEELDRHIKTNGLAAVVIDPTYLALSLGDSAKNLFEVGAKLVEVNQVFQENNCTPILAHHTRKNSASPFEPPELEDIAWAGFQEWARQWILIGRRVKYDPERGGHHELWLNIGGSAGHSSLWALNVDEGTRKDEGGRKWVVEILKASEARAEADAVKEELSEARRAEKLARKDQRDRERAIQALKHFPEGNTVHQIREKAPSLTSKRLTNILSDLAADGTVTRFAITKRGQEWDAYKLATF